jgi:hypothetical protein
MPEICCLQSTVAQQGHRSLIFQPTENKELLSGIALLVSTLIVFIHNTPLS